MDEALLRPIGTVSSPRTDLRSTVGWGDVEATIDLHDFPGPDPLLGLAEFSHVEVVFWFHLLAPRATFPPGPARGRADMPTVGALATRGPHRPNPIGVSVCTLLEVGATWLTVRGLDAVDGTPVLDVKPVMGALVPQEVREPGWSTRLMADYWTG